MNCRAAFWGILAAMVMVASANPVFAGMDKGATFAVFSDPHLYHASLGTTGTAFEAYLAQDRKLIRESEPILDAAIEAIIREKKVKFVLVPGDLTKDGERFNHFLFALKMKKLEKAGIRVFVVPGNHDVNNPHAFRYEEDGATPVPGVSPRMFKWIYHRCGYREALFQDPHSLSYVAEPAQGLWLIAMDSCSYDQNEIEGKPETAGRFRPQTLDWVLRMARLGKARGKQVIGMMHHGLIEHYAGQSALFPEYVVEDSESVSRQLAQAGLEVVFTGHYHANDTTLREAEGGTFVYDIETGSLVTWPSPLRIVTVRPNRKLDVDTRLIEDIDYDTGGVPFPDYARAYLELGLTGIASYMLVTQYGLPADDPQTGVYASQLAQAFMAHYAGDERPTPATLSLIGGYLSQPPGTIQYQLGQYLGALWTDLPPADTALRIDLTTGAVLE